MNESRGLVNETAGARWGYLGGLMGAVLGGFIWVVVAGVVIGDATIWATGALAAAVVWCGGWLMSRRYPNRIMLILGLVIVSVCVLDLAFLAWVLPRLPDYSGSLWFGTNRAAFRAIRPLAMIGSASGAFVTAWALWRYRSGGSKGAV